MLNKRGKNLLIGILLLIISSHADDEIFIFPL